MNATRALRCVVSVAVCFALSACQVPSVVSLVVVPSGMAVDDLAERIANVATSRRSIRMVGRVLAAPFRLQNTVGKYTMNDIARLEVVLRDESAEFVNSDSFVGPIDGSTEIVMDGLHLDRDYQVEVTAFGSDEQPISQQVTSFIHTHVEGGGVEDDIEVTFPLIFVDRPVHLVGHLQVDPGQHVFDSVLVELRDENDNPVIPVGPPVLASWALGVPHPVDLRDLRPERVYRVVVTAFLLGGEVASGETVFSTPSISEGMDDEVSIAPVVLDGGEVLL